MKLFITPEGEVCGVYHDLFRKLDLAPLKVERASNVEFNAAMQKWEATWPHGGVFAMADSRDECLQLERAYIENQMAAKFSARKPA